LAKKCSMPRASRSSATASSPADGARWSATASRRDAAPSSASRASAEFQTPVPRPTDGCDRARRPSPAASASPDSRTVRGRVGKTSAAGLARCGRGTRRPGAGSPGGIRPVHRKQAIDPVSARRSAAVPCGTPAAAPRPGACRRRPARWIVAVFCRRAAAARSGGPRSGHVPPNLPPDARSALARRAPLRSVAGRRPAVVGG